MELPQYVKEDKLEERLKGIGWSGEDGLTIMNKKYLPRDKNGDLTESPKERFYTIAKSIAEIEKDYKKDDNHIERLTQKFYEMISQFYFLPGGRIITNVGKDIALFNCYVLPVPDSIEDIFESVKKAAIIHKQGGGTGYNFSEIRPRGSYVTKSQGMASGPISFIEQFDKQTEIINSGNRRGANMGVLDVEHPDILDFIYAKTLEGRLQNFNISVGITNEFMKAVNEDGYYRLRWEEEKEDGRSKKELTKEILLGFMENIENSKAGAGIGEKPTPHAFEIKGNKIYDRRSEKEIGIINERGIVELSAKKVFDLIAERAWKTADPGLIFLDHINKDNPLPSIPIKTTNPCGEQPLHPYDACNLGSINLVKFVSNEKEKPSIDYNKLEEVVTYAVRFLDNVNDLNKGPLPEIEESVKRNRRIGLGVMGFADMLIKLGIKYDSEEGLKIAEEVMGFINKKARETSHDLIEEKGVFSNFEKSKYNTGKLEDRVRNLERTTIAPTGSISMLAGVNSGIEPLYAIIYTKNLRGGESANYSHPEFEKIAREKGFYSPSLIEKIQKNNGSLKGIEEIPSDIRDLFPTSLSISPKWHVRMQAAFQKNVDNAISKTINLPADATVEDIKNAYLLAWELGCKGITIYRDGSKEKQVLEVGESSPNLNFKFVELSNNNIEVGLPINLTYKIKREEERIHVILTTKMFKGQDNNYFLLPNADFQLAKPIGSELAVELNQSGIDRTKFLQGPDPDYVEFIKDLKSVRGDRSIGMGPNRIDSPSHAFGLCLEHFLLSQGVIKYNERIELEQIVKKKDLEEIDSKEAGMIFKKWLSSEKIEDQSGEMHVRSNKHLGIYFKCRSCGGTTYYIKDGCVDPVCKQCDWTAGKCD